MSEPPIVTVLMPVFNNAEFLLSAVNSVLEQTFANFEFLIIDDGSTDGSTDILTSLDDPRVCVFHNEQNIGLTRSLKFGLLQARGQYVARIDGDDVALPNRLEKQVAFLEKHPEIGILGSACYAIDRYGQKKGFLFFPEDHLRIRWVSLLANPFAHPTVMLRQTVLSKNNLNYDENFHAAQDYELWTRLLNYTRGANLNEPLLQYRIHLGGATGRQRAIQLQNQDIVAGRTIQEQLPEMALPPNQISLLRELFVGGSAPGSDVDTQRIPLIELYLEMLKTFLSRHSGESGWSELKRHEMLRLMRYVLRPPLRPGWLTLMRRLMAREPGLPWFFLRALPLAMSNRLRLLTLYLSR